MEVIIKAIGSILIAVLVSIILNKHSKEYALLLVICVCCSIAALGFRYYEQVFDFVHQLQSLGNLNNEMIAIMLKAVGTALLSEITVLICQDSGNSALGKAIQILSTAIIIYLCLPMFSKLLELIESIMGHI